MTSGRTVERSDAHFLLQVVIRNSLKDGMSQGEEDRWLWRRVEWASALFSLNWTMPNFLHAGITFME